MTQRELLQIVLGEHKAGCRTALCAIVATRGSTPQPLGAMIVVDEAAHMHGTIGGGCVEAIVRRKAHERLRGPIGPLETFELDHDYGLDDGMICGGQMDVAIQPIGPGDSVAHIRRALAATAANERVIPFLVVQEGRVVQYNVLLEDIPRLIIAGAGHLGRLVAQYAANLGFEVHVIDDRSNLANVERLGTRVTPHVGDIAGTLTGMTIDQDTFVVIVTRGHKHDAAALRAVINRPARYIGMIGSRRKIETIYEGLRGDGIDATLLKRVHAPIGLDIGAVRTEEIALSIAAELVQVRRSTEAPIIEGPLLLSGESS